MSTLCIYRIPGRRQNVSSKDDDNDDRSSDTIIFVRALLRGGRTRNMTGGTDE